MKTEKKSRRPERLSDVRVFLENFKRELGSQAENADEAIKELPEEYREIFELIQYRSYVSRINRIINLFDRVTASGGDVESRLARLEKLIPTTEET